MERPVYKKMKVLSRSLNKLTPDFCPVYMLTPICDGEEGEEETQGMQGPG